MPYRRSRCCGASLICATASPRPSISLGVTVWVPESPRRGGAAGLRSGHTPLLSRLAAHLEEASHRLDDLTVSAYIDDIAAVGPLEQVSTFFERLSTLSPSLGLALSLPKSSILWPLTCLSRTAFSAGQMAITFLSCAVQCLSLALWLGLIWTFGGNLPPSV